MLKLSSIVASFCVFIMICSIAFEPFLQQLIVFPVKNTPSGSLFSVINATSTLTPFQCYVDDQNNVIFCACTARVCAGAKTLSNVTI
jgi:hypothetical protein